MILPDAVNPPRSGLVCALAVLGLLCLRRCSTWNRSVRLSNLAGPRLVGVARRSVVVSSGSFSPLWFRCHIKWCACVCPRSRVLGFVSTDLRASGRHTFRVRFGISLRPLCLFLAVSVAVGVRGRGHVPGRGGLLAGSSGALSVRSLGSFPYFCVRFRRFRLPVVCVRTFALLSARLFSVGVRLQWAGSGSLLRGMPLLGFGAFTAGPRMQVAAFHVEHANRSRCSTWNVSRPTRWLGRWSAS